MYTSIVIFYIFSRIDIQTNGEYTNEESEKSSSLDSSLPIGKRPVSMYEPREGLYVNKMQQIPECRTTTSMYQMAEGAKPLHADNSISRLPRSDEVKYRTESITRRIQELWSVMQEMTVKDAFVPCSERIRVAVADLVTIFPEVWLT